MTPWLEAVKARLAAATPGPWSFPERLKWMRQVFRQQDVDKVKEPHSGCPDHAIATVHLQYCKDHSYPWEENARLIAHAPTDLTHAVQVIEAAERLAEVLQICKKTLSPIGKPLIGGTPEWEAWYMADNALAHYQAVRGEEGADGH